MFKPLMMTAAAALLLMPQLVHADTTPTTQDNMFVMMASQDSQVQLKTSQSAEDKATNPAVKAFAKQMADADLAMSQKLEKVVKSNSGLTMSKDFDQAHQQEVAMLGNFTGPTFDQGYVMMQDAQLKSAAISYQNEIANGTNADLKSYASQNLPAIQAEQQKVAELEKSIPGLTPVSSMGMGTGAMGTMPAMPAMPQQ